MSVVLQRKHCTVSLLSTVQREHQRMIDCLGCLVGSGWDFLPIDNMMASSSDADHPIWTRSHNFMLVLQRQEVIHDSIKRSTL